MALALNNLKRVDMPLNKETKPNHLLSLSLSLSAMSKIVGLTWLFILGRCYVLGKGHEINKTNTCLESRIKVICYSKTSNTSVALLSTLPSGFQSNVMSLLEESIVYQK